MLSSRALRTLAGPASASTVTASWQSRSFFSRSQLFHQDKPPQGDVSKSNEAKTDTTTASSSTTQKADTEEAKKNFSQQGPPNPWKLAQEMHQQAMASGAYSNAWGMRQVRPGRALLWLLVLSFVFWFWVWLLARWSYNSVYGYPPIAVTYGGQYPPPGMYPPYGGQGYGGYYPPQGAAYGMPVLVAPLQHHHHGQQYPQHPSEYPQWGGQYPPQGQGQYPPQPGHSPHWQQQQQPQPQDHVTKGHGTVPFATPAAGDAPKKSA